MNIQEQLKKINFKKAAYPAISILFFGIIILIFIYSAQFILKSTDKAFSIIDNSVIESQIIKVDLPNYYILAKKFGITIPTQEEISGTMQPATPANQLTAEPAQCDNIFNKFLLQP